MRQICLQACTNVNPLFHVDHERPVAFPKLDEQCACTAFLGWLHRVHAAARIEHEGYIKRHFLISKQ